MAKYGTPGQPVDDYSPLREELQSKHVPYYPSIIVLSVTARLWVYVTHRPRGGGAGNSGPNCGTITLSLSLSWNLNPNTPTIFHDCMIPLPNLNLMSSYVHTCVCMATIVWVIKVCNTQVILNGGDGKLNHKSKQSYDNYMYVHGFKHWALFRSPMEVKQW